MKPHSGWNRPKKSCGPRPHAAISSPPRARRAIICKRSNSPQASLPRTAAALLIRQAMGAMETARRQLCVARTRVARKLRAAEWRMRFQQASTATSTWRIEA